MLKMIISLYGIAYYPECTRNWYHETIQLSSQSTLQVFF